MPQENDRVSDVQKQIEKDIQETSVLLFMKGVKQMPLCGFSAQVVEVLNKLEVPYETILSPPFSRT